MVDHVLILLRFLHFYLPYYIFVSFSNWFRIINLIIFVPFCKISTCCLLNYFVGYFSYIIYCCWCNRSSNHYGIVEDVPTSKFHYYLFISSKSVCCWNTQEFKIRINTNHLLLFSDRSRKILHY